MQTNYRIIRTDGSIEECTADLPERPLYHQLAAIVGPILKANRIDANIEHVTVLSDDGYRTDMFVDEEGVLHGLPVNAEATRIYHRASIARGEKHNLGIIPNAPCIHGVAIYFERRVWW